MDATLLYEKAAKVVYSCRTPQHAHVARRFLHLAQRRISRSSWQFDGLHRFLDRIERRNRCLALFNQTDPDPGPCLYMTSDGARCREEGGTKAWAAFLNRTLAGSSVNEFQEDMGIAYSPLLSWDEEDSSSIGIDGWQVRYQTRGSNHDDR